MQNPAAELEGTLPKPELWFGDITQREHPERYAAYMVVVLTPRLPFRQKKVLLLEIANTNPPQYGLPGGGLKENESPIQAVLRELSEEVDMNSQGERWIQSADIHYVQVVHGPHALDLLHRVEPANQRDQKSHTFAVAVPRRFRARARQTRETSRTLWKTLEEARTLCNAGQMHRIMFNIIERSLDPNYDERLRNDPAEIVLEASFNLYTSPELHD